MKKLVPPMTIACSLVCLLAAVSCQRSVTPPSHSLSSQIIGRWTIQSAIVNTTSSGVSYTDTTFFTSADYFDFKADSTLSIMSAGVAYDGRWEIDNAKLYITGTNYMDFAGGFDLPVLDQHNLQIYDTLAAPNVFSDQTLVLSR